MGQRPLTNEEYQETVDIYEELGSQRKVAKRMGLTHPTVQKRLKAARKRGFKAKNFKVGVIPREERTVDEILEARTKEFERKDKAERARHLVPIGINIEGPIGVAHFGDPHVDDPGTDIVRLRRDVQIVKETEGMFGANSGDLQNNWIGRLAPLYSKQETTHAEAWLLVDWLVSEIPWLYIIAGNHDLWSGAGDPVKWIAGHAGTIYEEHGARVNLKFPNGKEVRINARHDFSGHSQWNTTHGLSKAVQMGWRDHVLTAGHRHISGYQILKDPASGLISHVLRISGYKTHDEYAKRLNLPKQNIFPTAVTIIDPTKEDDDPTLIHTMFDVEQAAEYLTWLRSRK